MFWPLKVPVLSTFAVRPYVPRTVKGTSKRKRVTISDTHQIKEVPVISYSSTEEEWEPASGSSEDLFDPSELVAETSDDLLALIDDYMNGPELLNLDRDESDDEDGRDHEDASEEKILEVDLDEDVEKMKAAGLPTAFGSVEPPSKRQKSEPAKKQKKAKCQNSSEIFDADEVLVQPSGDHTVFSDVESVEVEELQDEISSKSISLTDKEWTHEQVMSKYWRQRYSLWSRYDEGIWMDTVGWYSVTPEPIAAHIAKRCTVMGLSLIIWDPFGGLGGNAIQFALHGHHVICSDISAERLTMAQHNAKIYGVEDFIDFVHGDFFKLAGTVKADLVFLSPPWGGPAYLQSPSFDVGTMMDIDGQLVLDMALQAARSIIYFLPKNSSIESIAGLFKNKSSKIFEVEENSLDGRLKSVSVYYGPLFHTPT